MDGLSMHYYVHPEGWETKGSATEFDEKAWYKTLYKALYIETLIQKHSAIMDKYDPEKEIGLICDEWGHGLHVNPAPILDFCISRAQCATRLWLGFP